MFDLYKYAETSNVLIEYGSLPKNKSLSVKIGKNEYIGIDKSIIEGSAEERTLLAHELGHCATGTFYDINSTIIDRRRAEHKAIKWSILHCVPKEELIRLIKIGYKQNEIAEYFMVTEKTIHTAYTYYFDYGIAI